MNNNLRVSDLAVRFGPETGTWHKPHAEVKMAAVTKPRGSQIILRDWKYAEMIILNGGPTDNKISTCWQKISTNL